MAGILALICYFVWLGLYTMRIRSRQRDWLGRLLGVRIRDGNRLRWEVVDSGRLGTSIVVFIADALLGVLQIVGPLALVFAVGMIFG
jgi:hypothetical protein